MLGEKSSSRSLHGSRRSIGLLMAVAALIFMLLTYMSIPSGRRSRSPGYVAVGAGTGLEAAASNATVGLDSIVFLNLPHRHDRFDAMAIQSHLTKLKITRFPAVDGSKLTSLGMPPAEEADTLKDGEKGCFRAHANVWQHMLEKDVAGLLVLESDAGWDINFRPIMGRLNGAFRQLLQKEHPHTRLEETADDPWLARSGLWDLLSIGHCVDGRGDGDYVIYPDPHAPHSNYQTEIDGGEVVLNGQRIVYRAQTLFCTTGYLLSQSGAARLLVRTNWKFDSPVDVVMNEMIYMEQLRAYSLHQRPVVQWTYIPGIGKGTSNSDIQGNGKAENGTKEGWERAKREHSVYEYHGGYADAKLDLALGRSWHRIIGTQ